MADESATLRGINWREAFPFTNLFRAFRVAIHPSKIVLALVALLLLYIGGRVLDGVWPVSDRAVPGEIVNYESFQRDARPGKKFSDFRDGARKQVEADYIVTLLKYNIYSDPAVAEKAAKNNEQLGRVKEAIK